MKRTMGQNQSAPGGAGGPGDGKKDQVRSLGPGAVAAEGSHDQIALYIALRPRPLARSQEKKKKYEPPAPPPRVGKKQKKRDQTAGLGSKLPTITPNARCKLRLLKLERVKDYLLMEEEWVKNQELLKPHEERNEEDRSKARSAHASRGMAWHGDSA